MDKKIEDTDFSNGLDDTFWSIWERNRDLLIRCDMLLKINRPSYDHAVSWIENAINHTKIQTAKEIFRELEIMDMNIGHLEHGEHLSILTKDYLTLKKQYLKE